jgi:hypothetical protein
VGDVERERGRRGDRARDGEAVGLTWRQQRPRAPPTEAIEPKRARAWSTTEVADGGAPEPATVMRRRSLLLSAFGHDEGVQLLAPHETQSRASRVPRARVMYVVHAPSRSPRLTCVVCGQTASRTRRKVAHSLCISARRGHRGALDPRGRIVRAHAHREPLIQRCASLLRHRNSVRVLTRAKPSRVPSGTISCETALASSPPRMRMSSSL